MAEVPVPEQPEPLEARRPIYGRPSGARCTNWTLGVFLGVMLAGAFTVGLCLLVELVRR